MALVSNKYPSYMIEFMSTVLQKLCNSSEGGGDLKVQIEYYVVLNLCLVGSALSFPEGFNSNTKIYIQVGFLFNPIKHIKLMWVK